MRIKVWVGMGLWGFGLSSAGCGESETADPATVEDFAAAAARTFCDSLGGCCDRAKLSFDGASCRSETKERFLVIWTPSENRAYDPAAGGACLDQLRQNVVCGQADDSEDALSACEQVFAGTAPVGASCDESSECKSAGDRNVRCIWEGSATSGVCTVVDRVLAARGKLGDACDGTCDDDACDLDIAPDANGKPVEYVACYTKDGLQCSSADATCQPLLAVGERCEDFGACVSGAYCDFSDQQCKLPQPNGASCGERRDCESRYCEYDDESGAGTCGEPSVTADECADPDFD